jgi:hypothetical protein
MEAEIPRHRAVGRRRRVLATNPVQHLFETVLVSPLLWPGRTVRLERYSVLDYRNRLTSAQPSLAELYHENSKLFPERMTELASSSVPPTKVRAEYVRRRSLISKRLEGPDLDLASAWRNLLLSVAASVEQELFYAVEVRVISQNRLGLLDPIAGRVLFVKFLLPQDVAFLGNIGTDNEVSGVADGAPSFAIVGSFARNDLVYGERGYRRTLLEAGRLAQEFVRRGIARELPIEPRFEFFDRKVDAAMEVDGIEQGTLCLLTPSR